MFAKLDPTMRELLLNELNGVPQVPLPLLRKTLLEKSVSKTPHRVLDTPERQQMVDVLNYLINSGSFNVDSLPEAYVIHSGLSTSMKRALANYTIKHK